MHQRAKKGLVLAFASGGLLFSGTGIAMADAGAYASASGDNGVLSGNNVDIPVNAPITLCGDAVGVLGGASTLGCSLAGGHDSATVTQRADHDNGVIAGNNIGVPVNVPVTACGDAIAVLGGASSGGCSAGPPAYSPPSYPPPPHYTAPPRHHRHHAPPPSVPLTPLAPAGGDTPPQAPVTDVAATAGQDTAPVALGQPEQVLAHTGADVTDLAALGGGLLAGGVALTRLARHRRS